VQYELDQVGAQMLYKILSNQFRQHYLTDDCGSDISVVNLVLNESVTVPVPIVLAILNPDPNT